MPQKQFTPQQAQKMYDLLVQIQAMLKEKSLGNPNKNLNLAELAWYHTITKMLEENGL
jgi:hypothetical protein